MSGAVNQSGIKYNGIGDLTDGKLASYMKGWSLGVSGSIPVAGGQVLIGAAYLDAEAADNETNA